MKRVSNIYYKVYDIDNISKMCDLVCSKVRNKEKAEKFMLYKAEHIINIRNKLISKNINFSRYNIFLITDPKCRVIMSQSIEDKVINHLTAKYLLVEVYENIYTSSMCATRINKGSSYGINLVKKYLNEIKYKNSNFYYLKLDIKKYFYNIDHDILKDILNRKIKDKDALDVLYKIIDSTNYIYINDRIKKLKNDRIKYLDNFELIKETEEIPLYEYNKGCSIGNQTSQAFGLIYLCDFNHYLKEDLHLKYVVNYMDDFIIVHEDKKYLNYCLEKIEKYLTNKLKLELNINKTKINGIKNGIDFLGYRFIIKNNKIIMKLRTRVKYNFKRKIKNLMMLVNSDYINKKTFYKWLSNYNGLLKYGNCKNLYHKSFSWQKSVETTICFRKFLS